MYELTILNHHGEVLKRFDLSRVEREHKRVVIGRADDCDVRIAHGQISRHHCAIEPVADGDQEWIVRDLGSTHGVKVDGSRVEETSIRPGLEVTIGPAVLKFQLAAATAADVAAKIKAEMGE